MRIQSHSDAITGLRMRRIVCRLQLSRLRGVVRTASACIAVCCMQRFAEQMHKFIVIAYPDNEEKQCELVFRVLVS